MKKNESMSELLREALAGVDSLRELERETGIQRRSVARFLAGEQSLRLDKADILAEHFGIVSRRTPNEGR